MKEYVIDDIKNVMRPKLGDDIPLLLYRILRVIGMRSILGETSGATLYMMGKRVGNLLPANTMEQFHDIIVELKIGIPKTTVVDEDHLTVKLYECITCAGFAYTGEMFCDMESVVCSAVNGIDDPPVPFPAKIVGFFLGDDIILGKPLLYHRDYRVLACDVHIGHQIYLTFMVNTEIFMEKIRLDFS